MARVPFCRCPGNPVVQSTTSPPHLKIMDSKMVLVPNFLQKYFPCTVILYSHVVTIMPSQWLKNQCNLFSHAAAFNEVIKFHLGTALCSDADRRFVSVFDFRSKCK